ncbi:MAG: hypothetical protein ACRCXZ_04160 [Patescibacteria group bacterium]
MKKLYSTIAVSALGLTIAGLGVLSLANGNQQIKDLLVKGDFNGYKSALIDSAKQKADTLTEEEFKKMSSKAQNAEATKKAIEESNYDEFKKYANSKLQNKITNQEDFKKLVDQHKTKQAISKKIDQAVKDNNFDLFKSAQDEMKSQFQINKDSMKSKKNRNSNLTQDELKSKFETLVSNYKVDGSLPSDKTQGKGSRDFHSKKR